MQFAYGAAESNEKNSSEELGMSNQQNPAPQDLSGATDKQLDPAAAVKSAQQVGEQLKNLREIKKWSIEDVSARLKVAPYKLRELELGDYSHLPDTTFAIGVVRSYAKMLGADPTPLTDTLRRTNKQIEHDFSLPSNSGVGLPRGRVAMNWGNTHRRGTWVWIIAFVIALAAVIAVWRTGGEASTSWVTRLKTSDIHAFQDDVFAPLVTVQPALETSPPLAELRSVLRTTDSSELSRELPTSGRH
ncbi:helix-turn-helix domain-containing protein [Candidatus Vallotia cooleyia]|uniref:helix-turn-helix domain-containing protein n=1 Tax=Candidatus Vallotiella adelgis TaxID=1177211 RepID=UPI001D02EF92|nr:helix-turn-helix domain-containing protein [Candidatus Vallotia cooleyia]UDG81958.1 hypothetical protein GJV44_00177 [Candidatus Vallotia cooleyia]